MIPQNPIPGPASWRFFAPLGRFLVIFPDFLDIWSGIKISWFFVPLLDAQNHAINGHLSPPGWILDQFSMILGCILASILRLFRSIDFGSFFQSLLIDFRTLHFRKNIKFYRFLQHLASLRFSRTAWKNIDFWSIFCIIFGSFFVDFSLFFHVFSRTAPRDHF